MQISIILIVQHWCLLCHYQLSSGIQFCQANVKTTVCKAVKLPPINMLFRQTQYKHPWLVTCPPTNCSCSCLVTSWKTWWILPSADVTSIGGPWMRIRFILCPFSTVIFTMNSFSNALMSRTFKHHITCASSAPSNNPNHVQCAVHQR